MTHFTHPLTFQEINDTTVEALFAADDQGNVAFVSATLRAALVIDAAQAERIAGAVTNGWTDYTITEGEK